MSSMPRAGLDPLADQLDQRPHRIEGDVLVEVALDLAGRENALVLRAQVLADGRRCSRRPLSASRAAVTAVCLSARRAGVDLDGREEAGGEQGKRHHGDDRQLDPMLSTSGSSTSEPRTKATAAAITSFRIWRFS